MGGRGTRVTTDALTRVSNTIEQTIGNYRQSVSSMWNTGQELDAMWEGPADQKFQSLLGNDMPQFELLANLLTEYVNVLRESAKIYSTAEQNAIDTLNTNTIRK